ncbi:B2 bradykinin receptor-like [Mugil cephalus]|uniref:B2 bradykinin receptor-like n=1 Tax=Mugil cephalus TaxID=48193 RepID=UPI001FB5A90B|nr:B2 bradykinin receptor-like [Mugil cephalus]XP_047467365.1 B2 bradykinin receptor-like [Mugil cephalus]
MDGNQTKTNASLCLYWPIEWHYLASYWYILVICVLGIVFNVFVLTVLCLHKKACTAAEIYLSNLAAADLPLLSALPFWAQYVVKVFEWPFGRGLCKMVNVFMIMSGYCSIYSLVLISIDRYLALVFPLSHERLRRPLLAKVGCLVVWVLSFVLSVPDLIYRDVKIYSDNSTVCTINYPNYATEMGCEIMQIMLIFIIPIFIISFYSLKTFQALRNRPIEGVSVQKRAKKATLLIVAALLVFLICWIPFHMMVIIYILENVNVLMLTCNTLIFMYVWYPISMYLKIFTSVLNPILYVFVGKNFRKKVKEISKCQK